MNPLAHPSPQGPNGQAWLIEVQHILTNTAVNNQAAHYHMQTSGSNTRARICIEACLALGVSKRTAIAIACAIELLHNASLVHDDVQDKDPIRREQASVWRKFNVNLAICAGDQLISEAYAHVANIDSVEKMPIVLEALREAVATTISGQCRDIQHDCSTLREYEEVAAAKSGPLLQLALQLPLLLADRAERVCEALDASRKFATAYQIADDLTDWRLDEKNNSLNIVNVLRQHLAVEQAIEKARARSQYLLKSCQVHVRQLPSGCGKTIDKAAAKLYSKVSRDLYA